MKIQKLFRELKAKHVSDKAISAILRAFSYCASNDARQDEIIELLDIHEGRSRTHWFMLDGKRLTVTLTVTERTNNNVVVSYRILHDGVVFTGDSFSPSRLLWEDADGRQSAKALLGFFATTPGDTDDEFFKDYTPEQLAWANKYAQLLALKMDEEK